MTKITITDLRRAGHCAVGIKRWFDAQGLDFKSFLKDGIDDDVLRATGDGQVLNALKQIEKNR